MILTSLRREPEPISDRALMDLLDRNGASAAAQAIHDRVPRPLALRYLAGRLPRHDDSEGLWLQEFIDAHNPALAAWRRFKTRLIPRRG